MSTGIPTTVTLTAVTMLAATTLDPTLLAAAVVTIIAALGGVTVQIINARSAALDRREAAKREELAAQERKALFEQAQQATKHTDEANKKADVIIEKATGIEHLTNSTNHNLQAALQVMTEKVAGLEKLKAQLEEEKRTTAATRTITDMQTAASLQATPPKSAGVAGSEAEESLAKIEDHTEATAKNTAKTDATMQEMKDKSP